MTIINYCHHNDLTLDIVPVAISVPGVTGGHGSYTFGYKFVHLSNHLEFSKSSNYLTRLSLGAHE